MHLASQTAILLSKEVQEHRDYFYNTFLKPYCEPASSKKRGKGNKNQASKQTVQAPKGKNYLHGQDAEIPFTVSHENQEDYLHKLDPTEWKTQDQYLVLGLGDRRYRASNDDVKRAYKKLILKHHPDKRRQKGEAVLDETKDYFACITKAFDVLGDPEKRKAYDSVDSVVAAVADDVPDKLDADEKNEFFEVFEPVFRWNSRWSVKQPVPQLGDINAKEEYVDEFYDFWYNFDSWRDYSFLDEAVSGEDRYERRAMEKENKEKRKDRKSKEMGRLRKLVDSAFASDPRIAKFKDEEKRRKEAEKQAKKDAQRARQEAEDQLKREAVEKELEEKRLQEEVAKAESEKLRKERDAEKKVLKKERKTLRDLLKGWNYFSDQGGQVKNMHEAEKLCDALTGEQLQDLNQKLSAADLNSARALFFDQVSILNRKFEAQRLASVKEKEDKEKQEAMQKQQEIDQTWNDEELKLLVKAVNLYPAGTGNRWEVVAEYINHHLFLAKDQTRKKKTAKDVIAKSKSLTKIDQNHEAMKNEFNKKAFDQFATKQKTVLKPAKDDNSISERFDQGDDESADAVNKPWAASEQKLLEQAMKQFPSSDPQRWENVAKAVQTRSRDECEKRFKKIEERRKNFLLVSPENLPTDEFRLEELVEKLRAQKVAAAAAKTAK